jgi:trimethylamine:corrinoid methyltransferase-like protein
MIEKRLHEEACLILEEVGVRCDNRKIIDIFEDTGLAAYDETSNRLHILRDLVDGSLDSVPKRDKWLVPEHSFGSGGTAPYVYEDGKWAKPDVYKHVSKVAQIAEKYKLPFIFRAVGDMHGPFEDVEQIKVLRQHYNGFIYLYVSSEEGVMACAEEYSNNKNMCTTHSILFSPLSFNDTGPNMDVYFKCVENRLPIYLVTMPLSSVNSPATIYGTALLAHAEFLAGLCLTQSLCKGLPTIHAGYPMVANPQDGYNIDFGSVAHNLCNITVARMGKYLNIPSIQSGCTTSVSKIQESTEYDVARAYTLWNSFDHWHQVRHCFGFSSYQNVFCLDKMERDINTLHELLDKGACFSNKEALSVRYDDEAVQAVRECASVGTFLEHWHTLKNTRIIK